MHDSRGVAAIMPARGVAAIEGGATPTTREFVPQARQEPGWANANPFGALGSEGDYDCIAYEEDCALGTGP